MERKKFTVGDISELMKLFAEQKPTFKERPLLFTKEEIERFKQDPEIEVTDTRINGYLYQVYDWNELLK